MRAVAVAITVAAVCAERQDSAKGNGGSQVSSRSHTLPQWKFFSDGRTARNAELQHTRGSKWPFRSFPRSPISAPEPLKPKKSLNSSSCAAIVPGDHAGEPYLNPYGLDWCRIPTMQRDCLGQGVAPYDEWAGYSFERGEAPRAPVALQASAGQRRVYTLTQPERCTPDADAAAAFDQIYTTGKWSRPRSGGLYPIEHYYTYGRAERFTGNSADRRTGRDSMSGVGSKMGFQTFNSLLLLAKLIRAQNITTMLDVPCGDANWIFEARETDALEMYVGIDLAKSVINLNRERFAHHANKQFHVWDLGKCPIPQLATSDGSTKPFDLIHVRDVLQHMTLAQGGAAAHNLLKSGAKFIVATTYHRGKNTGVETDTERRKGAFFLNDLSKAPYNFPAPISCVRTDPFSQAFDSDDTCIYRLTDGLNKPKRDHSH